MGFYDIKTNTPGYLTSQLSSDTAKVNSIALSMVGISVQTISTLIIAIILGLIYDWRLALINLALVPLTIMGSVLEFKLQQGFSSVDEVIDASAGSILSESVTNIRTLYCYNMQDKLYSMYQKVLAKGMRSVNKNCFINGVLYGMSQFIMFITYSVLFYAGGAFLSNGTLTLKNMYRAIFILQYAAFGLGLAQQYIGDISKAKSALVNIYKTIDEPSTIDPIDIREKNLNASKPENFRGEIEFQNVSFKYSELQENEVLKNLSFKILPGQKAAFVGGSGSGKSTVIQLIERFYDAGSGKVLIDGIDIKDYDLIWLRQNISCVLQEPCLFQRSNYDNILYGKLTANDSEVKDCAKRAKIADLIKPDSSRNVSGGQKQRLALARAIIKNPKIMLFDEFTSALNSNLEKKIMKTLKPMLENRTSIMVAHRLSTIKDCDVIFVMDSGRIIEKGNHSELYQLKGRYHNLYNIGQNQ
jgi:ATP-binding cassette subfamily B (MDR/TAP) protein 1